ncbi:hypothetical protein M758_UG329300 [Ceratodon purpureus]|nr:hypothetical protein M758_UG329300 [Ceratodon purpureus]
MGALWVFPASVGVPCLSMRRGHKATNRVSYIPHNPRLLQTAWSVVSTPHRRVSREERWRLQWECRKAWLEGSGDMWEHAPREGYAMGR